MSKSQRFLLLDAPFYLASGLAVYSLIRLVLA